MRIVIVANKFFEADPLVSVLLPHGLSRPDRVIPDDLINFVIENHPFLKPSPRCRIKFTCGPATVEVWCLQDLMNPAVSSSSSHEKARVLPQIIGDKPSLVIAFGTAGSTDPLSLNGSVVIGSRVFVHDPKTSEKLRYKPAPADSISTTQLPDKFFRNIDTRVRGPAEQAFLRAPLAPSEPPVILAGHNWISIGAVNVTNYDDYVWTDPETIARFERLKHRHGRIGSMETTHGIIQQASNSPFLYVSGIANRIPYFDVQNVPRNYAQNFVAAHNAAVALAWLLPETVKQLP